MNNLNSFTTFQKKMKRVLFVRLTILKKCKIEQKTIIFQNLQNNYYSLTDNLNIYNQSFQKHLLTVQITEY